jgi:hypothetical protein
MNTGETTKALVLGSVGLVVSVSVLGYIGLFLFGCVVAVCNAVLARRRATLVGTPLPNSAAQHAPWQIEAPVATKTLTLVTLALVLSIAALGYVGLILFSLIMLVYGAISTSNTIHRHTPHPTQGSMRLHVIPLGGNPLQRAPK